MFGAHICYKRESSWHPRISETKKLGQWHLAQGRLIYAGIENFSFDFLLALVFMATKCLQMVLLSHDWWNLTKWKGHLISNDHKEITPFILSIFKDDSPIHKQFKNISLNSVRMSIFRERPVEKENMVKLEKVPNFLGIWRQFFHSFYELHIPLSANLWLFRPPQVLVNSKNLNPSWSKPFAPHNVV